jgi:hypothetical protein
MFVVPNQPPSVIINASSTTICVGSLSVLTATPIDAGGCATYTWWVDGVPDPSSTTAIFNYVPLTAGTHVIYCVVHSCDTCDSQPPVSNPDANSNAVTIIAVVCTGVYEIDNNSSIKIYPNPSDGKFTLYWENNSVPHMRDSEIFISDCLGKRIASFLTDKNYLAVDESALSSGIYFITINSGSRIYRSPVVIY